MIPTTLSSSSPQLQWHGSYTESPEGGVYLSPIKVSTKEQGYATAKKKQRNVTLAICITRVSPATSDEKWLGKSFATANADEQRRLANASCRALEEQSVQRASTCCMTKAYLVEARERDILNGYKSVRSTTFPTIVAPPRVPFARGVERALVGEHFDHNAMCKRWD